MAKLKIINIDNYDYTLEDDNGNKIIKNIEFQNHKPNINDYLYMSKKITKETNIFQYGIIYNFNNVKLDEIIKLETKDGIYFLQRYYG